MDDTGVVCMMNRGFGNTWTQVANTKKHVRYSILVLCTFAIPLIVAYGTFSVYSV